MSNHSMTPTPTGSAPLTEQSASGSSRLTYDHALSPIGRGKGWWRGVLFIAFLIVGFFVTSMTIGAVGILISTLTGELSPEALGDAVESGVIPMTPAIFVTNNLALAALLPLAYLGQRMLFGVRPGTISSVTGRFRWAWFRRLALVIVPVFAVYSAALFLLEPAELNIDGTAMLMLVFVLLTTPFQAASEEYVARGGFQRAAGSWFAGPQLSFIVGTAVSATLFCLAHGAGDWWLIGYYFFFGVIMSVTVKYTGGLESAVLIHSANNVMLFIPAVLTGQLSEGIDRSAGAGGPIMLLPAAFLAIVAAFVIWRAKKDGIETTTAPLVTAKQRREAEARAAYELHAQQQAQLAQQAAQQPMQTYGDAPNQAYGQAASQQPGQVPNQHYGQAPNQGQPQPGSTTPAGTNQRPE
ncbi:lysostaphin resistance A-like protein [Pseudoclavibacter sp. JSM 162008]|uniref:CPBP family intramembrane glutamic endopeptidase n=1 Tax=Pseudoclavibacter sp. JSM 162008 TaxID=3229855 RepID=UPI00352556B8